MTELHEIISMVYAAKEDSTAADQLIQQYLPFIKAETARFMKRPVGEQDDELSIAMFAFYEAAMSYEKGKGAFLPYGARGIKNRLIDYVRKEQRHQGQVSLNDESGDEDDRTLLETLDSGCDNVDQHMERTAVQEEIAHYARDLADFGLSMTDIAENCPKQDRTLAACHRVLAYARENQEVFEILLKTKKLPVAMLAANAGVERKTMERHRKYIVAMLLAYTNGFEIIRGHLSQTAPGKGGLQR